MKKKVEEPKMEKGQLDQTVGEKQKKAPAPAPAPAPTRSLWAESSGYFSSEAAGHDVDPFTSMFLLT